MKKIFTLICCILFQHFLFAQTEVISGVSNAIMLEADGNDLYITQTDPTHKITKIDVTAASPSLIDVSNPLYIGYALLLNGQDMLVVNSGFSRISKLDLTGTLPVSPSDVVLGLTDPYDMVLNGNDLYVSEWSNGRISKANLTDNPPTASIVIDIDGQFGSDYIRALELKGNDLYLGLQNRIAKIDITSANPTLVDVVTHSENWIPDLLFVGNDLYFPLVSQGKISKINITESNPTIVDVVTGLTTNPRGMARIGTDLYFVDGTSIKKIALTSLSVEEVDSNATIKLYPNPSNDHILLSNLNKMYT
ncbi:MAG: hypothetical protein AAF617_17610 [Bacteroidota bacterium]